MNKITIKYIFITFILIIFLAGIYIYSIREQFISITEPQYILYNNSTDKLTQNILNVNSSSNGISETQLKSYIKNMNQYELSDISNEPIPMPTMLNISMDRNPMTTPFASQYPLVSKILIQGQTLFQLVDPTLLIITKIDDNSLTYDPTGTSGLTDSFFNDTPIDNNTMLGDGSSRYIFDKPYYIKSITLIIGKDSLPNNLDGISLTLNYTGQNYICNTGVSSQTFIFGSNSTTYYTTIPTTPFSTIPFSITPYYTTPMSDTPYYTTPTSDTSMTTTPYSITPYYTTPTSDTPYYTTPTSDTPNTPMSDTPYYTTPMVTTPNATPFARYIIIVIDATQVPINAQFTILITDISAYDNNGINIAHNNSINTGYANTTEINVYPSNLFEDATKIDFILKNKPLTEVSDQQMVVYNNTDYNITSTNVGYLEVHFSSNVYLSKVSISYRCTTTVKTSSNLGVNTFYEFNNFKSSVQILDSNQNLLQNFPLTPNRNDNIETFDITNHTPLPTTPYQTTPYQTTPYQTTPYKTTPYKTTPYQTTPYQTTPYQTTPYQTTPYQTTPYQTTPYINTDIKINKIVINNSSTTLFAMTDISNLQITITTGTYYFHLLNDGGTLVLDGNDSTIGSYTINSTTGEQTINFNSNINIVSINITSLVPLTSSSTLTGNIQLKLNDTNVKSLFNFTTSQLSKWHDNDDNYKFPNHGYQGQIINFGTNDIFTLTPDTEYNDADCQQIYSWITSSFNINSMTSIEIINKFQLNSAKFKMNMLDSSNLQLSTFKKNGFGLSFLTENANLSFYHYCYTKQYTIVQYYQSSSKFKLNFSIPNGRQSKEINDIKNISDNKLLPNIFIFTQTVTSITIYRPNPPSYPLIFSGIIYYNNKYLPISNLNGLIVGGYTDTAYKFGLT